MTQIKDVSVTKTTLAGTEYLVGQDAAGGPGSSFKLTTADFREFIKPSGTLAVTDGQVLSESDIQRSLTNLGAGASVTATLPPAVQGLTVIVTKIESHTFRLDVNGTDFIRGGNTGGYLEIVEGTVVLGCMENGAWEIVGQSHAPSWVLENGYSGGGLSATSRIDLRNFVSLFAEPGESVVFSGADWETVPPDQAQRRKNWRILMEACLKANGGTGEYNGLGWYCTSNLTSGAYYQGGGVVYIDGPLYHEPYADAEYAPFFATADTVQPGHTTRGWTFPGGLTIEGNNRQFGRSNTWAETGRTSARLIGYGSPAARWYGGAGPTPTSGGHYHVSNWALRKIGLVATAATAATAPAIVLHVAHYHDGTSVLGLNQFWTVDDVHIDLEPGAGAAAQVGFLNQTGLTSEVPRLSIHGHLNPGWGLVHTGLFNGTAKVAQSSTVRYGHVICINTGRGVLFSYGSCFIDILDIEGTAVGNSKAQLVLGDDVAFCEIGQLWMENLTAPGGASGADNASVVIGGIDSEWNPTNYGVATYNPPGLVALRKVYALGPSSSKPNVCIKARAAYDFTLDKINASGFTSGILQLTPGTVSSPADYTKLKGSYDSSKALWGSAAAFLVDDTVYANGGQEFPSLVTDRALESAGRAPVIPDSGTYVVGQKILHTAPTSGSPIGWVATGTTAASLRRYGASYLEGVRTALATNNLGDGAGEQYTVTVTGAALGDFVQAGIDIDLAGITQTAWVSAADTVTVRHQNESGGAVNLGTGRTLYVRVYPHQ
jgi:hypothetical protein